MYLLFRFRWHRENLRNVLFITEMEWIAKSSSQSFINIINQCGELLYQENIFLQNLSSWSYELEMTPNLTTFCNSPKTNSESQFRFNFSLKIIIFFKKTGKRSVSLLFVVPIKKNGQEKGPLNFRHFWSAVKENAKTPRSPAKARQLAQLTMLASPRLIYSLLKKVIISRLNDKFLICYYNAEVIKNVRVFSFRRFQV